MTVNRKLEKTTELQKEYDNIINEQLVESVVEEAPENPSGDGIYYMPHKAVVRQDATTTKVRMAFGSMPVQNQMRQRRA